MSEEVRFREPDSSDAARLHHLMTRVERGDDLPMATSRREVDDLFESPDLDPAEDLFIADVDGELVGYGVVQHAPSGERHEQAFLSGGVEPDYRGRGIGRHILDWQVERAQRRLASTNPDLPAHLIAYGYEAEVSKLELFERHGFRRARFEHEMLRPLDHVPDPTPIPGIAIRSWESGDAEPARRIFNAAFADHWGSTPRNAESWRHMIEEAGRRLDLSLVAVDELGDVVAIALNGHYPDDTAVTGRRDGWIESLGTLRAHRKRGIASALLIRSMAGFAAAGFDHAMLGVDGQNPTGAYGIYERLGFTKLHTLVTMQRTVREAYAESR
jgi:ribosomal protein S18 acetylase RimI-like enzyme